MARLHVLHCLVNSTTRQHGSPPTSDLLGVNYFRTVPADTEFPKLLPPFELFVRFAARRRISGRVWVVISSPRPDAGGRRVIYRQRFTLPVLTAPADVVYDKGLKLVGVTVPGPET
ncbi:MAG: hypothetical protein K2X87_18680 [Gemmataceae bacterium]|nr:hypothetical protein [Gemmataceae bacterium]